MAAAGDRRYLGQSRKPTGIDNCKAAGAGLHAHMRITIVYRRVRRYELLTIFDDTRVVQESVDEARERLRPNF